MSRQCSNCWRYLGFDPPPHFLIWPSFVHMNIWPSTSRHPNHQNFWAGATCPRFIWNSSSTVLLVIWFMFHLIRVFICLPWTTARYIFEIRFIHALEFNPMFLLSKKLLSMLACLCCCIRALGLWNVVFWKRPSPAVSCRVVFVGKGGISSSLIWSQNYSTTFSYLPMPQLNSFPHWSHLQIAYHPDLMWKVHPNYFHMYVLYNLQFCFCLKKTFKTSIVCLFVRFSVQTLSSLNIWRIFLNCAILCLMPNVFWTTIGWFGFFHSKLLS